MMKSFRLCLALALLAPSGLFAMNAAVLSLTDTEIATLDLSKVDLTNVDAIVAFLDKYTPRTSEKVEALLEAELVRRRAAGLPLGIILLMNQQKN